MIGQVPDATCGGRAALFFASLQQSGRALETAKYRVFWSFVAWRQFDRQVAAVNLKFRRKKWATLNLKAGI
jgi:hypothetical protein